MGVHRGQFKTGDGQYCYPLTVTDHFSRTLLVCRGLPSVRTELAKPVFRALFREVGLPDAIRTDNGAPFASTGIHGLSALNVWWMQLGIVHQRILPASPQENGQHERMHRERKRETAWTTSTRDYPARILPPDSPAHLEVRRSSSAGTFRLHSRQPFLTRVREGEDMGLEAVAAGIGNHRCRMTPQRGQRGRWTSVDDVPDRSR